MTSGGPFRPKTFYDSMITDTMVTDSLSEKLPPFCLNEPARSRERGIHLHGQSLSLAGRLSARIQRTAEIWVDAPSHTASKIWQMAVTRSCSSADLHSVQLSGVDHAPSQPWSIMLHWSEPFLPC